MKNRNLLFIVFRDWDVWNCELGIYLGSSPFIFTWKRAKGQRAVNTTASSQGHKAGEHELAPAKPFLQWHESIQKTRPSCHEQLPKDSTFQHCPVGTTFLVQEFEGDAFKSIWVYQGKADRHKRKAVTGPVQSSYNIPSTLKYFLQKGEGGSEAFDIKVREKLIIIMSKM